MLVICLFSAFVAAALWWFVTNLRPRATRVTPADTVSRQQRKVSSRIVFYFATQSGTAEMYCKTLLRESQKLGLSAVMADVEDYSPSQLNSMQLAVFIVATYGEGEPTDSFKSMFDWLMGAEAEQEDFSQLKYTVFGLGDSQYTHFCKVSADVDERLQQLGATRIHGMGQADASKGGEEVFDEWRASLWPAISKSMGISLKLDADEPFVTEYTLRYVETPQATLPFPQSATVLEPTHRLPTYVTVVENSELLQRTRRSTRHIVLDISNTILSYQAGDHIGILPCNADHVVTRYLGILRVPDADADRVISLQDQRLKNMLPARVTVRTALKWYYDLQGVPRKSALRAMAHCCEDEAERSAFLGMLRGASSSEYNSVVSSARTVLGVLERFKSCRVPLGIFLEVMPRMTPRYYSIASDQLTHSKQIHIMVAITPSGVCTSMLQSASVGMQFPAFVRKSSFHLPIRSKNRPVVFIGPGTGVAPFIGFCHRRQAWRDRGQQLGDAILFFGCRSHSEDFVYESFLKECISRGILTSVVCAFSRDQAEKIYVQHRLKERALDVWNIIAQGGNVYVCGDAKHMARDVEAALLSIISEHGKVDGQKAKEMLSEMATSERYLKDVWTA